MSDKLDERMNGILSAVREHWSKYGLPPSLRWLGETVGIPTTSMVVYYIDKLVEEGKLRLGSAPGGKTKILRPDESLPTQAEVHPAG